MFENLLSQPAVVNHLKHDISHKAFPSSVLFYGPDYSGKMTAALEVARVLNCSKSGEWSCKCKSCQMNRTLSSSQLMFLGDRYFLQEIAASAEVLKRTKQESAGYLLLRAVKKLTKRFDQTLWEGDLQKINKAVPVLNRIEEFLDDLLPIAEFPEKKFEKGITSLLKDCNTLSGFFTASSIPIVQIRNISSWARVATPGSTKVVIIEQAEKMQEGSRNALLKILEEPPSGIIFILLTSRRGSMMPTILSRVRTYSFAPRGSEASKEVLRRIFKDETGEYPSLRDFFLAWEDETSSKLRSSVRLFFSDALYSDNDFDTEKYSVKDRKNFLYVLQEMMIVLQNLNRDPNSSEQLKTLKLSDQEVILETIRHARKQFELMNLNVSLILESMYYQIREKTCVNSYKKL